MGSTSFSRATHPIMRHFVIGSLLFLAAVACAAEIASEDTVVSNEDFQVPNESFVEEDSPVSALAESEADIESDPYEDESPRSHESHHKSVERNNKARLHAERATKERAQKRIHWLPGWCNNWRGTNGVQGSIPGFERRNGVQGTKEQCQAACDSDSSCHQAVFESQGPWGTGCFLGGNTMSNSQRPQHGSRNCDRNAARIGCGSSCRCVDECYNKAGWASTRL